MTLAETLLPKLADWRPAGAGRHSLTEHLRDHGWTVGLTADRVDTLGVLAWELTLRRSEPGTGTLKDFAAGLAKRATGLMEPLALIEADTHLNEAVVRSTAPAPRGDRVQFYEVRFKGTDEVTLRRFQGDPAGGRRREQIPFALTHEAVAKFAGDVAAA